MPPNSSHSIATNRPRELLAFSAAKRECAPIEPNLFRAYRSIPASFTGGINFSALPQLQAHRQSCATELARIPGCFSLGGRKLIKRDYQELLEDTMAVVCPWGRGEVCRRNYEAALAQCAIIRPECGYKIVTPDGLPAGQPCDPEWRDLPRLIQSITANWQGNDGLYELACRDAIRIREMNTPQAVAARLAGFFEEALR